MRTPPVATVHSRPRRRRSAALALVVLVGAAACSAQGTSRGGAPTGPFAAPEATTTTGATDPSGNVTFPEEPATTTEPDGGDDADFDPCELVNAGDLAAIAPDLEPVLVRGLAYDDPRIDECRLDSVTAGSVSVGVVAHDQGALTDLVGSTIGTGPKTVTPVVDLGDEALVQRLTGAYVVVVEDGGRQLRVRVDDAVMVAKDPKLVVNLARTALGRLPDELPEGGELLPDECAELDVALVEAVVGEVVLARGGSVDDGFTCDYLGADGTKAYIDAYRTDTPIVFEVLKQPARWAPIAGGQKSAVSSSGQFFIAQVAPDVELVVDTGSALAADAGFAVAPERRALFLAAIPLAEALA